MPNLKSQLEILAENLTRGVLDAIRGASLEELLAEGGRLDKRSVAAPAAARKGSRSAAVEPAPKANGGVRKGGAPGGRLARRSPSEIEHVVGLVVAKLREHKTGMRSEQLQAALKLSKKEISRPLSEGLAKGRITKKGEKRATTYFAK
jgi:hypothetical protein